MIRVVSAEVDRTSDYVDMLQIPWYGSPMPATDRGSFTPGRITSFTVVRYPVELAGKSPWCNSAFLISWYDQPAPSTSEMLELVQAYVNTAIQSSVD